MALSAQARSTRNTKSQLPIRDSIEGPASTSVARSGMHNPATQAKRTVTGEERRPPARQIIHPVLQPASSEISRLGVVKAS